VNTEELERAYLAHVADLIDRYAPVLAAAEVDAVVLHSGSTIKRSEFDDQYWPLRPTPHFQHWLPLAHSDCALILRPGHKPVLAWLKSTSYWETPEEPASRFFERAMDVQSVSDLEGIKAIVPAMGRVAFIGDASAATQLGIQDERINPATLVGPLDRLRAFKTPYEVMCLTEANRKAAAGHAAALAAFRAGGASELEIHLRFLEATGQDDPETPYKNIVAEGPHAATLHHVSYDKRPSAKGAQSLLVDAGATYMGYCSDITRTWVRGEGAVASAYGQLVDGVEKMQQRLCGAIKLGLPYEELHEESHRQAAAILRDVGIAKGGTDELVKANVTRSFYPHGLGHSLGLQCHDVGCALVKPKENNPYLRNTSIIGEGQCFTVEPGIYFIPGLLDKLRASPHAALIDWALVKELSIMGGVRIEDDVVITGAGGTGGGGGSGSAAVTRNLTREVLPVGGGVA
jgi:Xaa-Pro dipeptidase